MATVLTTNLVLQKTKLNSLDHVKRLNACGVQVRHIDVLRDTINIEVLSLSVNNIEDLNALGECFMLRELFLRKNAISDIRQVLHLSSLENLLNLGLSENAICEDSSYRPFVISAIPSLTKLDDIDITHSERVAAARMFPDLHLMRPPSPIPVTVEQGQGSPVGVRGSTPKGIPPPVKNLSFSDDELASAARSVKARHEEMQQRRDDGWDDVPVGGRPARRPAKKMPPPGKFQDPFSAPLPNRGGDSPPPRNHLVKSSVIAPQPVQNYASAPSPISGARRDGPSPTSSQKMNALEDAAIEAVKGLLNNMSPFAVSEIRIHLDSLQHSQRKE